MKVLITGCAGYIGAVVSAYMLDMGHKVIGLDSLISSHQSQIPSGVSFYQGEIDSFELLSNILETHDDIQAVFHFAAFIEVAESVQKPDKYFNNNFQRSKTFIDNCISLGLRNFLYSSTAAVYDSKLNNNNSFDLLKESHPTNPLNPYGKSKLMMENYLQKLGRESIKLNIIIFRYFNASGAYGQYGEKHNPETHIIPLLIDFAIGKREYFAIFGNDYSTDDGTAVRDYVHVLDIARAHEFFTQKILKNNLTTNLNIFNIAYSQGHSVQNIIDSLQSLVNKVLQAQSNTDKYTNLRKLINSQDGVSKYLQFFSSKITTKDRRVGDPPYLVADNSSILKQGFKPQFNNIETILFDALRHRLENY